MTLNANMNTIFYVRLGPGAIVIKKRRHNNKKRTRHITDMRAAFFQREARAVTVGELGMIQRAAEFSMNTNPIPNPTVNKHCARYE